MIQGMYDTGGCHPWQCHAWHHVVCGWNVGRLSLRRQYRSVRRRTFVWNSNSKFIEKGVLLYWSVLRLLGVFINIGSLFHGRPQHITKNAAYFPAFRSEAELIFAERFGAGGGGDKSWNMYKALIKWARAHAKNVRAGRSRSERVPSRHWRGDSGTVAIILPSTVRIRNVSESMPSAATNSTSEESRKPGRNGKLHLYRLRLCRLPVCCFPMFSATILSSPLLSPARAYAALIRTSCSRIIHFYFYFVNFVAFFEHL